MTILKKLMEKYGLSSPVDIATAKTWANLAKANSTQHPDPEVAGHMAALTLFPGYRTSYTVLDALPVIDLIAGITTLEEPEAPETPTPG